MSNELTRIYPAKLFFIHIAFCLWGVFKFVEQSKIWWVSEILIGIHPGANPMTNFPPKNGWNSLQPPEMELQSLVSIEAPS